MMVKKTKKLSPVGKRLKAIGLTHHDFAKMITDLSGKAVSSAQAYQWYFTGASESFRKPSAAVYAVLRMLEQQKSFIENPEVLSLIKENPWLLEELEFLPQQKDATTEKKKIA